MQDNVEKVMEKQERLETLNDKADALNDNSMQFKRGANKVRKAMWWKDLKLKNYHRHYSFDYYHSHNSCLYIGFQRKSLAIFTYNPLG
ncbi:Vesicle membrane receptor protein (v-SNARE), variant 2 [Entomophthora muscae]|nr:Vesicle membrane receptor protein (v-SNARE), variant 2 [Entomophthora muscae]